jgi:hypothetical protein
MFLAESINLSPQILVFLTLLPHLCEFGRSPGNPVLKAGSSPALTRARQTGEEIRCRLLLRAFEAHIDEELLGDIASSEEDLFTLVQNANLVEEVVGRLRSLVDGDNTGCADELGGQTKILAELDGVGGV